jgi:hypothetical protein
MRRSQQNEWSVFSDTLAVWPTAAPVSADAAYQGHAQAELIKHRAQLDINREVFNPDIGSLSRRSACNEVQDIIRSPERRPDPARK